MVVGLLVKFGMMFIRPKTALLAWGTLAAVAVIGYGVWSWNRIDDLKRDNIETVLKIKNEQLEQANNQLKLDQESMLERMDLLAGAIEDLNGKFGQNARRRAQDLDGMTGPRPQPGETVDTTVLQDRANTGMNNLFDELETVGAPDPAN